MRKYYIVIGLSLFVSLFIYLFYRTEKTVINDLLLCVINCDDFLIMQHHVSAALPLPEPVVYSLPGGLWVFSVTLSAKFFVLRIGRLDIQLLWLPLIFAVGLESFQLLRLTNGRFDAWDVVFSFLGWSGACLLFGNPSFKEDLYGHITSKKLVFLSSFVAVFLAHVLKD